MIPANYSKVQKMMETNTTQARQHMNDPKNPNLNTQPYNTKRPTSTVQKKDIKVIRAESFEYTVNRFNDVFIREIIHHTADDSAL